MNLDRWDANSVWRSSGRARKKAEILRKLGFSLARPVVKGNGIVRHGGAAATVEDLAQFGSNNETCTNSLFDPLVRADAIGRCGTDLSGRKRRHCQQGSYRPAKKGRLFAQSLSRHWRRPYFRCHERCGRVRRISIPDGS